MALTVDWHQWGFVFLTISSYVSCTVADPCQTYTLINDPTRSVAYTISLPVSHCDRFIISDGWYRFQDNTNRLLPTTAPAQYRCGTERPIWLSGIYPTVPWSVLSMTACIVSLGNTCASSFIVQVKNCVSFHVFFLKTLTNCPGRYCTDVIDCSLNPCENNGTCTNLSGGDYNCTCVPGTTGTNCENQTDECASSPCENGGTCTDLMNDFNCTCPPGYSGKNCSLPIDECMSNPCLNNATCTDLVSGFNCTCLPGFNGTLCENNIDDCLSQPCQNNGTCTDHVNGFKCECSPGFISDKCENATNECDPDPCQNQGTCQDLHLDYNCHCADGYFGKNCSEETDECMSNPCLNNATCTDLVSGFNCTCVPGFNGTLCENNIDDCLSQPCQNSGTCTDNVDGFKCECLPGFIGDKCENTTNECDPDPCQNQGTCQDLHLDYNCLCADGYFGKNCSEETNECDSNPCENGGTCTDLVLDFNCTCPNGYYGKNCSLETDECMSFPCLNNATCTDLLSAFNCTCVPGFNGTLCETNIDDCLSQPCQNNGTCTDNVNGFYCECSPGFIGDTCESTTNECDPDPCQNQGSCLDLHLDYNCLCVDGYFGKNCSEETNECEFNPCENGGNCTDLVNDYNCTCVNGYYGKNCSLETNECDPNPCENGGNCTDLMYDFNCTCPHGYYGKNCNLETNECDSNPCQNGGTCTDLVYDFNCTCPHGYYGKNCSLETNECDPNPCLNCGSCVDGIYSYQCHCKYGYYGQRCQNGNHIVLVGDLQVHPFVPTTDLQSPDRVLMFDCWPYIHNQWRKEYIYEVKWIIDDDEITKFCDLNYTEISSHAILRANDWITRPRKIGFNVRCAVRAKLCNESDYSEFIYSKYFFAGIRVWPLSMTISSGTDALVYYEITVPVACPFNEATPCSVYLEMYDFHEQFIDASSFCANAANQTFIKPSACGLILDGWRNITSSNFITVKIPANALVDQQRIGVLKLRSIGADSDIVDMWSNYHLPEVQITVVGDNISDPYHWTNGYCFSTGDPWIVTFDYLFYNSYDQGEFVLYKHKTKPIEVHTIQRRRYHGHHFTTENCAVAVRAASDIFIIYGCGNTTKWEIRRLNCDQSKETLIVYKRGPSYEIVLPTGSRVYISCTKWRLNVVIILSRQDRDKSHGLCGNWNGNQLDDLTTPDGHIANQFSFYAPFSPYSYFPWSLKKFVRSWSVPYNESLFVAKSRTEILSLFYYYCSCLSNTLGEFLSSADCSWRDEIPLCPMIHWVFEACEVRVKRGTDGKDDITIDAPEEMVSLVENEVTEPEWKNNWDEASARKACVDYFKASPAFEPCTVFTNADLEKEITTCVLNIKASGTDEYISDSLEAFTTKCVNEVRTNTTLLENQNIYDSIINNVCPSDCRYQGKRTGVCQEGACKCYKDYAGEDCRVNVNEPPVLSGVSEQSACDLSKRPCSYVSMFGEGFYASSNLKCRFQNAKLMQNAIEGDGEYTITTAELKTFAEVRCKIPHQSRKKRATTSADSTVYLVSVTINAVNFSNAVAFVVYDSSCRDCYIADPLIICNQRNDVCIVGDKCFSSDNSLCVGKNSQSQQSGSVNNLWIIGAVLGGVAVIVLIGLLVKVLGKKSTILPLCGSQDYERQVKNSSMSLQELPPPYKAWEK